MNQALTIRVRHEHGCAVVTAAGEVDIATAGQLREQLSGLAASGRPLVADLDQVSFIDAAGLGALAGAARRAAACGGSLRVVCTRPRTRRLFQLTGLDRHIPLARTVAEAVHARTARDTPAGGAPGPPGGEDPPG